MNGDMGAIGALHTVAMMALGRLRSCVEGAVVGLEGGVGCWGVGGGGGVGTMGMLR